MNYLFQNRTHNYVAFWTGERCNEFTIVRGMAVTKKPRFGV
jgi:hypothetical protein